LTQSVKGITVQGFTSEISAPVNFQLKQRSRD
jgi:hypothetical protein